MTILRGTNLSHTLTSTKVPFKLVSLKRKPGIVSVSRLTEGWNYKIFLVLFGVSRLLFLVSSPVTLSIVFMYLFY